MPLSIKLSRGPGGGSHPGGVWGVPPSPPRAPTRDAAPRVRIGSRGVFVPVSRHFLWVPNTHQPKPGVQGAKPPWRGLGCPQALPFTPLAACGGEEKRFLGTPQTPSKGLQPFAILLSSVRVMHIGHSLVVARRWGVEK